MTHARLETFSGIDMGTRQAHRSDSLFFLKNNRDVRAIFATCYKNLPEHKANTGRQRQDIEKEKFR